MKNTNDTPASKPAKVKLRTSLQAGEMGAVAQAAQGCDGCRATGYGAWFANKSY